MNKLNFTKAFIDALPLAKSGNRDIYHDKKIPGLQLRVTSVKTFFINRRVKGGDPQRITLGRYPDMTIEQARRKAIEIAHIIADGKNPGDIEREARKEMTLDTLFEEYMARCAVFNKRPDKPKATYRLYLSSMGKRKLSTIKHEEIDRIHKRIGREIGVVTANIVLKLLHVMFNCQSACKTIQG